MSIVKLMVTFGGEIFGIFALDPKITKSLKDVYFNFYWHFELKCHLKEDIRTIVHGQNESADPGEVANPRKSEQTDRR